MYHHWCSASRLMQRPKVREVDDSEYLTASRPWPSLRAHGATCGPSQWTWLVSSSPPGTLALSPNAAAMCDAPGMPRAPRRHPPWPDDRQATLPLTAARRKAPTPEQIAKTVTDKRPSPVGQRE